MAAAEIVGQKKMMHFSWHFQIFRGNFGIFFGGTLGMRDLESNFLPHDPYIL